ncbi:MAG: hypothetical protein ACK4JB_17405 [Reyranella sp.]
MSWQKYTPVARGEAGTPVTISIPDEGSRGSPFILIDEATMKALGWKAESRIMLSIGTDEHHGKLRLEPAAGEPLRVLPPRGVVKRHRITVGRLPCLGTDRVRGACGYQVEKVAGRGAALVITLPDDARSHQLPRGTAAAIATASGKGGAR